jgi:hypothetical protein
MQFAKNEKGFSVLEVAVAAFLTVGLLAVVFLLVNRNQQVYVTESTVTDMNQNLRTSVDLLTRDIQAAGMGLQRPNGCFAAVYYVDGASGAPDSMMILNGDSYAPSVDVDSQTSGSFTCTMTGDITVTGSGSSSTFTYLGAGNSTLNLFQGFSTAPKYYVVYDDLRAQVFALTGNGQYASATGKVTLNYNTSNYRNPPTLLSTALGGATVSDTGDPDYPNARIAMLGSMVAYRLNTTTGELLRTEDLTNWYAVARGLLDLQVRYRLLSKNVSGTVTESMSDTPADRRDIRSVEVTIRAETPDIPSTSKSYRQAIHKFEVAPRNFNLLNNTNLSSNLN